MIAFIPGISESGAFIQMISPRGSKQYAISDIKIEKDRILMGNCIFSSHGIKIDLPDIHGTILYSKLSPLSNDIMGPFRFLPMQCRHGVISMFHTLKGSITVDNITSCFDNGIGYIEKDSGRSFPRSYLWLQCNDFSEKCALMVSIAHIPFCGLSFIGCICAILYKRKEYRFATYHGVRILSSTENEICLKQGSLLLYIQMMQSHPGHILSSPKNGLMSESIRECCNAKIRVRLWDKQTKILDLRSDHATFEFELKEQS